jgi:hypothetical protein
MSGGAFCFLTQLKKDRNDHGRLLEIGRSISCKENSLKEKGNKD